MTPPLFKSVLMIVLGASLLALAPDVARAAPVSGSSDSGLDKSDAVTFVADVVSYDDQRNTVVASGHVEIANSQHLLMADKVVYDRASGQLAAMGHVVLHQATGEVVFADKMQLTRDMKDGFMTSLGIVMADNSRFTAPAAERFSGRWTRMYDGAYSPCALCADKPDQPTLWQIEAREIVHDNVDHDITYHDAWLDFYGEPVLYTPYMSMPDPTVKRRSGFLTPTVGFGSTLGTNLRTPYYYDIEPQTDLLVTPWFTSNDNVQADAILRHRFSNGYLNVEASGVDADYTEPDGAIEPDVFRGHLQSTGLWDFSGGWRAGENILLTTDDTYLPLFNYASASTLTNRVYAENFSGRDYFVGNAYYFENTVPGVPRQPIVGPDLEYSAYGQPGGLLGGRWNLSSGVLDVVDDGALDTSMQRASLAFGWERKIYSNSGLVSTFDANLRNDLYDSQNFQSPDNPNAVIGQATVDRLFPSTEAMFSYPLARRYDTVQQTIEPIMAFYAATVPHDEGLIPNLDSQDFELDATNLFDPNRFTGIDRVEGGTRATYGVRSGLFGDGGGSSSVFLGQSHSFEPDPNFPDGSGLNGHNSDYVGQLEIEPSRLLTFDYNFRLNNSTLSADMHEADITAGDRSLRATVDYLYIDDPSETTILGTALRQQITYGVNSALNDYWTLAGAQTVDLTGQGILTSSLRLIYNDECLTLSLTASVNNTNLTGISNGPEFLAQISFKGLGGEQLQPFNGGAVANPAPIQY